VGKIKVGLFLGSKIGYDEISQLW